MKKQITKQDYIEKNNRSEILYNFFLFKRDSFHIIIIKSSRWTLNKCLNFTGRIKQQPCLTLSVHQQRRLGMVHIQMKENDKTRNIQLSLVIMAIYLCVYIYDLRFHFDNMSLNLLKHLFNIINHFPVNSNKINISQRWRNQYLTQNVCTVQWPFCICVPYELHSSSCSLHWRGFLSCYIWS